MLFKICKVWYLTRLHACKRFYTQNSTPFLGKSWLSCKTIAQDFENLAGRLEPGELSCFILVDLFNRQLESKLYSFHYTKYSCIRLWINTYEVSFAFATTFFKPYTVFGFLLIFCCGFGLQVQIADWLWPPTTPTSKLRYLLLTLIQFSNIDLWLLVSIFLHWFLVYRSCVLSKPHPVVLELWQSKSCQLLKLYCKEEVQTWN